MRGEAESFGKLLEKSLLSSGSPTRVPFPPLDIVLSTSDAQDCCGHLATSLQTEAALSTANP